MEVTRMYGYTKGNKNSREGNPLSRFYAIIIFLIFTICMFSAAKVPGDGIQSYSNVGLYIAGRRAKLSNDLEITEAGNEKIVMISVQDMQKVFNENIYVQDSSVVVPGKHDVVVFYEGKKDVAINEGKKEIITEPKNIDGNIYISLNDLKGVFKFDMLIGEKAVAIFFNSDDRKYVTVTDDAKLKNNRTFISGTITKLKPDTKYIVLEEYKNNLKIITDEVVIGYIPKSKVSSEIVVEGDKEEEINPEDIHIIANYRNFKENFDEVQEEQDKINMCLMDFIILRQGKNVERLYDSENEGFRLYKMKLEDENIKKIGILKMLDEDSMWYSENLTNYDMRKDIITEIISYVEEFGIDGIYIDISKITDKALYNRFKIELGTRLKGKGKLLLLKDNNESNESESDDKNNYYVFSN